jgi:outer membrane receptor for ferrienterochelin and colicins
MRGILAIVFILGWSLSYAQGTSSLDGRVLDKGHPLAMAHIKILGTGKVVVSDDQGNFMIPDVSYPLRLEVSSIGYKTRIFQVESPPALPLKVPLEPLPLNLEQVVVTGTLSEVFLKDSPVKVEVLPSGFFQQNMAATLMESLYMVNGIQEKVDCSVCGTNAIMINGMEGPYTLVLIDGMPIMSSLASVYGLNGISPAVVDRVEIVRGPSSTLFGSEALGGVVNIITKSPENTPKGQLESFYSQHGEWNTDLSWSLKKKNWSTLVSANRFANNFRLDANQDGFTDIPLQDRITLFNAWRIQKDNREVRISSRILSEERFGGQMHWQPKDKGSNMVYGEHIRTQRYEVMGSYPFNLGKLPLQADFSVSDHHQLSYYGDTKYAARQGVYFLNFIWQNTSQKGNWTTGLTLRKDIYSDNAPVNSDENLFIPGVFGQYEWLMSPKFSIMPGLRIDHYQSHGVVASPRFNIRWKADKLTTLRLNGGTGFRRVNLFTEEHAALTGSRTVVLTEKLAPERSWSTHINLNRYLTWGHAAGTLDFDVFFTRFSNKIVPDYLTDSQLIIYQNMEGHGISRGMGLTYNHYFHFPMTLTLGITAQEVFEQRKDEGPLQRIPQLFVPELSGVFALNYTWTKPSLTFDWTGNATGPQHLPEYAPPFQRPTRSEWFSLQHVQVTWSPSKGPTFIAGVKNLWNYTQSNPLIDPENPFGDHFDTAYVWGPLQPRRVQFGIRWTWK